MQESVTVEYLDTPPEDRRIHDFDELDEDVRHALPLLIDRSTRTVVSPETAAKLREYDVVKFVDYWAIRE
jgi:hypothetical protein